jgi:hypothetical protein
MDPSIGSGTGDKHEYFSATEASKSQHLSTEKPGGLRDKATEGVEDFDKLGSQFIEEFMEKMPEDIRTAVQSRIDGHTGAEGGKSSSDVIYIVKTVVSKAKKKGLSKGQLFQSIKLNLKSYVEKPENARSAGAVDSAYGVLDSVFSDVAEGFQLQERGESPFDTRQSDSVSLTPEQSQKLGVTTSEGAGEGEQTDKQERAIKDAKSKFGYQIYCTIPSWERPEVSDRLEGKPGKGGNSTADVIKEFNKHIVTCVLEGKSESQAANYIKGKLDEYINTPGNERSKGAVKSGKEVIDKMLYIGFYSDSGPMLDGNIVTKYKDDFLNDFSGSVGSFRSGFASIGFGKSNTRTVKEAVGKAFLRGVGKSEKELYYDMQTLIESLDGVKDDTKDKALQSLKNVMWPDGLPS